MQNPSSINVLMYHSISDADGPTSISPELFRQQVEILAECGYETVSLATFKSWCTGKSSAPQHSVVITFDDGFADFADRAFPVLKAHGYNATVFLPAEKMGKSEDWDGANHPARPLMSWSTVAELMKEGMDFGGHSCTHPNLTKLKANELEQEVRRCREIMESRLGLAPVSFAPPYGLAGIREREEIAKWFAVSVGTRLGRATRTCDPYDVPRIEMHYFRNGERWRKYLKGRGEWHLRARRVLRGAREFMTAR